MRLEAQTQTGFVERKVKPLDRGEVLRVERNAERGDACAHARVRGIEYVAPHRGRVEVSNDRSNIRADARARRRPAEQQREIFRPVRREREDGLEEQVLQQIVAADIDEQRYARANLRDVRKILIRSYADVRATSNAQLTELPDDMQVRRLVRYEVVGVEVAAALRQPLDSARERRGRKRRRLSLGRRLRRDVWRRERGRRERPPGEKRNECAAVQPL